MNCLKPSRLNLVANRLLIVGALIIAGCSSNVKKVDFAEATDPTAESARIEQDIQKGYANHYDLLANEDFTKAQKELERAKKKIAKQEKPERVLESLGYAQGHLNKAAERTEALKSRTEGILEARSAALAAGVRKYPELDLKRHDDEVREDVDNIDKGRTTPERWAFLQQGYRNLELKAIQNSKLADARSKIQAAIKQGARKNTPNMLTQAQRDMINAESVIAADRHNESAMAPAVAKAQESAGLLTDVLAATKQGDSVINEDVARELVMRNRQVQNLNQKLADTSSEVSAQSRELAQQSEQINADRMAKSLDTAIEDARKEFTSDEADVYRQGDKLLIRLKAINFSSGRSDLPAQALPLLAKVRTIATELNAQQIVVEGHTDSTGKAATNKELSQNRAEAVASYLATNGLDKDKIDAVGRGFEKPIMANKSKEGRAQNRRVDVIITPAGRGDTTKSM